MLELIITIGAACAVLAGFWRWALPRLRGITHDLIAFKAAILGRDAVKHPETGVTLVPAQPGLGTRVASIELAVIQIARTHQRLDDHEQRLARLERGVEERTAARTETVELLRVVDTALKTPPPEDS